MYWQRSKRYVQLQPFRCSEVIVRRALEHAHEQTTTIKTSRMDPTCVPLCQELLETGQKSEAFETASIENIE